MPELMDPNPEFPDVVLMARVTQREEAALSVLYDRYARLMMSLAYQMVGSQEEAEEVVIDVFAQVWRTAKSYDASRGRVDSWLFMMTRSRSLDRLRSVQRSRRIASASADAYLTQTSYAPDPADQAVIQERRERVIAVLNQLPQDQRLALELAYFKGLTQAEIAELTATPLGTVKTRIRLALNKLRGLLEPDG